MTPRFLALGAIAGLSLTFNSCNKEDPELVRKRDEQRTEIKRLEGEISVLDEKLKDVPPDHTQELTEAKAQAQTQATEVARLEKDVAALEDQKRTLEKTFSDYRHKYPVKNN